MPAQPVNPEYKRQWQNPEIWLEAFKKVEPEVNEARKLGPVPLKSLSDSLARFCPEVPFGDGRTPTAHGYVRTVNLTRGGWFWPAMRDAATQIFGSVCQEKLEPERHDVYCIPKAAEPVAAPAAPAAPANDPANAETVQANAQQLTQVTQRLVVLEAANARLKQQLARAGEDVQGRLELERLVHEAEVDELKARLELAQQEATEVRAAAAKAARTQSEQIELKDQQLQAAQQALEEAEAKAARVETAAQQQQQQADEQQKASQAALKQAQQEREAAVRAAAEAATRAEAAEAKASEVVAAAQAQAEAESREQAAQAEAESREQAARDAARASPVALGTATQVPERQAVQEEVGSVDDAPASAARARVPLGNVGGTAGNVPQASSWEIELEKVEREIAENMAQFQQWHDDVDEHNKKMDEMQEELMRLRAPPLTAAD